MLADDGPDRPWAEAWQDALYGEGGFYRRPEGPAGHFTTASHGSLGSVLAHALLAVAAERDCDAIVDLGAGRGELLTALRAADADVPLIGIDVIDRPKSLAPSIDWQSSPGGATVPATITGGHRRALVVANEWLDVVPCPIAELDEGGALREVAVDHEGRERLTGPLSEADRAWVERWWPLDDAAPGDRVEVGRPRDDAWARVLAAPGVAAALAIDYGHVRPLRPRLGTLAGYRDGALTAPIPDGRHDLTAHVAVDSLPQVERMTQRDALARWGPPTAQPPIALARTDPAAYRAAIGANSAAYALRHGGTADFWWVLS